MKLTKKEVAKQVYHVFLVIFGNIILSLGVAFFLVPYDIIVGGVASIGMILNEFFGLDINITVIVLTWSFFLLGWIFLGKKFAIQTIIATIVYPLALALFLNVRESIPLLNINPDAPLTPILAAIFGGSLSGIGIAISFLGGGSTGGVDIIALVMQKYFNFKCSKVTFIVDALTIMLGFFTYNDLSLMMIGIIGAVLSAIFVDKIFIGGNFYIAYIISSKWKEINDFIISKIERGTTLIDSVGGYSGEEKKMIQVSFSANEYIILQEAISTIDNKAFMTVSKAYEVKGEGFNPYIKRKKLRLEKKLLKEGDQDGRR